MTHIEELACISESSGSQFFRATSGIQSGSDAFIKGGKRFFKNGSNGRDGKFLLEMGRSQEWGGGVLSLHSWQGVITPLFYEEPLYCLPHPPFFFKFCPCPSPPLPCHLQPPPHLFFLLSCFFGWMGDHTTFDVLFYLMIIWIYTWQALVRWYRKDLDVCFMH